MINKIKVKPGQTISDLSIQLYGDRSGVFDMVKLNGLRLGQSLTPGQEILYDDSKGVKDIKDYIKRNNLEMSTGKVPGAAPEPEPEPEPIPGGDFNGDFNNDFLIEGFVPGIGGDFNNDFSNDFFNI